MLVQIAKKPAVLKTASPASLKKKEFIAEAVAVNPKAIKYAAEEILADHAFLKKLAATDGMVAAHIPLKYNSEAVFHAAIGNTLDVVQYIPKKIYKQIADGLGIVQEEPYIVCDALSRANEYDIDLSAYLTDEVKRNKEVAAYLKKQELKKKTDLTQINRGGFCCSCLTFRYTKKYKPIILLLYVKSEYNHIAVLHNVLLALASDQSFFFSGSH